MVFGWYGLGRMWIEGLRTDSLYLFGSSIRVSQLLAAIIFTVCAVALIYLQIKKPKGSFYFKEKKTEEAVKNKKK
jgi:phosphatidylglycerol:prolipoprotein diacylglycerol transferase